MIVMGHQQDQVKYLNAATLVGVIYCNIIQNKLLKLLLLQADFPGTVLISFS